MTHEEAREYVERWRKAGPELEKVRREELRRMSDADALKLVKVLLEVGSRSCECRATSGLVEQQRIFRKARL
jgi:hypothetical protein